MMGDYLKAVEAALSDDRPIPIVLREAEIASGFELARQNGYWLPDKDWHEDTVASLVWQRAGAFRLVLAVARKPGNGAFTRLASRCKRSNCVLIVVDPTKEFAAMLERRGFVGLDIGETFDERERWFVPLARERQARLIATDLGLAVRGRAAMDDDCMRDMTRLAAEVAQPKQGKE
jgi:hypothetical protein